MSTPICWRWFHTPLQPIFSQKTSWCGKSLRYFRNRSKKVKAWSALSPMQLSSVMCVPFIHPWATWCYHIMQITHCSKFYHLSKQPVRGGAAGTWASASRSVYLCNPASWPQFYLLLWWELLHCCGCGQYSTVPMEGLLWARSTTKQLILQGYMLGNLAFLLEHYIRKWKEKLAYIIKINNTLKQCLLFCWVCP